MKDKLYRERVMALAGMFQAAYMVQQVARQGEVNTDPFSASLYSLFQTEVDCTEEVFGGLEGIRLGLTVLLHQFRVPYRQRDLEPMGYVFSLLILERKLRRHPDLLERIHEGLEEARNQVKRFSLTHTNTVARLAGVYADTISTLKPRIMVKGEPIHLQNTDNIHRIRALLLAGIRASVLWRQLGGSRVWLLLRPKFIGSLAATLLNELQ